jgi:hypothetical protein
MMAKLTMTATTLAGPLTMAILLALVTTLAIAETATLFETGIPQQRAYAQAPCADGYHWNGDIHSCVAD